MRISYNWLKSYINFDLSPEEVAEKLTATGLEVEKIEKVTSIEGGLEGLVVGEVLTREKHPDADRLSVTTVNVGNGEPLNIVCGAPNVAAGQKVVIAPVGAMLYPVNGEPFKIKKSKIRGALSEGMICAEDEIGLGEGHEGIMVLPPEVKAGILVKEHLGLEDDYAIEIGLTPNRTDAISHIGVARDLAAVLSLNKPTSFQLPSLDGFKVDNNDLPIAVEIQDSDACPRYAGISIKGIKVGPSPDWLKDRLTTIGLKPINNVVDITNFVLHELGQPLHAFDSDKIGGQKIVVRFPKEGTNFKTLDEVERKLSADDLMICDTQKEMCIAGVFGGMDSGISDNTTNVFLESAYFNAVYIRKTARRHGLNTDASFRFERGADPEMALTALKRAALLIKEIAGGTIASEIVDVYPKKAERKTFIFNLERCDRLIGKSIDRSLIKNILTSLEIEVSESSEKEWMVTIPSYRVDVVREADVVEEVLRIYGYDNVEVPEQFKLSVSYTQKPDPEDVKEGVSNLLAGSGFLEIMANSLTKAGYVDYLTNAGLDAKKQVKILNPLSADLNAMRQTLLFGGLEAVAYNQNHKTADLKLFEFGKAYELRPEGSGYEETRCLGLFLSGRKDALSWNTSDNEVSFYYLKGWVDLILRRLGLFNQIKKETITEGLITEGLTYFIKKQPLVNFGLVNPQLLGRFDIKKQVFYANFNWDLVLKNIGKKPVLFSEISKYQGVRRDLALLLDEQVKFSEIEELAYQTERKLLKEVGLFDVYQGKNLEAGKKSYAAYFMLQDEQKTLNDKQIEKVMAKLQQTFEEKLGAKLR